MDTSKPGGMAGQPRIPREIVESETFANQRSRAVASPRRLDDLIDGLLFTIARIPEDFPGIGGVSLARYVGPLDRLRIWFTYDDDFVTLQGIERVAPGD
jgi:hypothetical protein